MLYSDGTLDIELEETTHMLDEVTITSGRIQNVKSTQLGAETLRPTQLKKPSITRTIYSAFLQPSIQIW